MVGFFPRWVSTNKNEYRYQSESPDAGDPNFGPAYSTMLTKVTTAIRNPEEYAILGERR